MALGDLMASRFSQSVVVSNHLNDDCGSAHGDVDLRRDSDTASSSYTNNASVTTITTTTTTSLAYLPQTVVLCELRHEAFEASTPTGPSDSGLVSKWRPKDRVSAHFKTIIVKIVFFWLILSLLMRHWSFQLIWYRN